MVAIAFESITLRGSTGNPCGEAMNSFARPDRGLFEPVDLAIAALTKSSPPWLKAHAVGLHDAVVKLLDAGQRLAEAVGADEALAHGEACQTHIRTAPGIGIGLNLPQLI